MNQIGFWPAVSPGGQTVADNAAWRGRAGLIWAVAGLAGAAGLIVGLAAGAPGMDAELVPLLRFMAVIKAAMALGAVALAQWRLKRAASGWVVAALAGSSGLMMSAPGLIWGLTHLVLGAVLFHAGLLVFLVAAARDGFGMKPAVSRG
jgi:hypothetical protein